MSLKLRTSPIGLLSWLADRPLRASRPRCAAMRSRLHGAAGGLPVSAISACGPSAISRTAVMFIGAETTLSVLCRLLVLADPATSRCGRSSASGAGGVGGYQPSRCLGLVTDRPAQQTIGCRALGAAGVGRRPSLQRDQPSAHRSAISVLSALHCAAVSSVAAIDLSVRTIGHVDALSCGPETLVRGGQPSLADRLTQCGRSALGAQADRPAVAGDRLVASPSHGPYSGILSASRPPVSRSPAISVRRKRRHYTGVAGQPGAVGFLGETVGPLGRIAAARCIRYRRSGIPQF